MFIDSRRQLADIFTQPLGHIRFEELWARISMIESYQGVGAGLGKELLDNLLLHYLPCIITS
jgi:hypothetical protein